MYQLKIIALVASFLLPFLLSGTLFFVGKKGQPKIMAWVLVNTGYVFLANYFYFLKMFEVYSIMHSLHIATVLWIFPSIYIYLKTLVNPEMNLRKLYVHLVPGLLFGLISAFMFYGLLVADERVYYLSTYRSGQEFSSPRLIAITIFRGLDVLMIVVQVVYYSFRMIKTSVRYNKALAEEFTDVHKYRVTWVNWFTTMFVISGLLCIWFYMFNPFHSDNDSLLLLFLFFISFFIWLIGIWSLFQQQPTFKHNEILQPLRPKGIPVNESANQELSEQLLKYFESKKPYLQSNLTLTGLCREVGTNRTYLSSIINNDFQSNFSDFVNKYRIDFANQYFNDHPDISLTELAETSGFGSVSSLKRAQARFKQKQATF